MSYYRYGAAESRPVRGWAQPRGQRATRFWTWFWCIVGAAFLIVSLAVAGNVATLLASGFLPHSHT